MCSMHEERAHPCVRFASILLARLSKQSQAGMPAVRKDACAPKSAINKT
jgi:hypothetical protein